MSKCRMRTKNTSEKSKFGLKKTRPRMNYGWIGKTIWKKDPIQISKKTVKIRVKLPHVNKKPPRKRIFVQKPFSHSTLKFERKNFTQQKTRFFAPLSASAWKTHSFKIKLAHSTKKNFRKRDTIL